MNVSATQQSYTNYQNQSSSSTSKTESTSGDFLSAMQEVEEVKSEEDNKEVDLLDINAYKNMSEAERSEVRSKLIEKYGKDKGESYSIALFYASSSKDDNMQKAIFDKLSNMPKNDTLDFMLDLQLSLSRHESGGELKAGYSLEMDENGEPFHGDSNFDLRNYLLNISPNEFESIFSSLSKSHKSLEKVVGKQAIWYANIFDDILNSYNSYKEAEKNSYQPYA